MLKRQLRVEARFDESEYFQLHRNAQQIGNSVSAYIRRCCLSDAKVIVIDRRVIRDVYREMNAIGKNINQIAKIANSDRRISPASIDRAEAMLEEIWRVVDEQLGGIRSKR
ncbi:MAG TPA: hypothetical protein DEB31_02440 [Clostridiales bacterium]|nr:hypothetical protein [Clostridiales bacterium]